MSELISVIIPIYNVSAYLERCIESVVRQTYRHLQIILVDDGSTDRSGEICDEWEKRDGRIEVYHTLNRGLVRARKFGLDKSRGGYVCFVDGDDYIDTNMYEELSEQIVKHDADFVHSGYIEERGGGGQKNIYFLAT